MTPEELRSRATHYRTMATQTTDVRAIEALLRLADEYEALATKMERMHLMSRQIEGC
jgi:hypothetical protein